MAEGDGFYRDLAPFDEFGGFAEFAAYSPVPDGWQAVVADVEGSTRAIAEGRYKAVNMVGAAVITAVLNVAEGLELPFVFGGDGGIVLVPGRLRQSARAAMAGLKATARREYGLGLRAATVPVSRIRAEGGDLRVRKLRLSPGNHLAMLAGGGAALADTILKTAGANDPDLVAESAAPPPDLEGLSCRWEPLRPQHGRMLALIVQPAPGQDAAVVLSETLANISRALAVPLAAHAPVSDATLRFRFPPTGLGHEVRAMARGGARAGAWVRALGTAFLQALAERFGLRIGPYDQPRYRRELKANTDFRKFDDSLRVVLDVTPAQAGAIAALLGRAHTEGRIDYGLHVAEEALMTCLVFSLERSEHVHFVDAAGGGFARAAEGLKSQIAGRGP